MKFAHSDTCVPYTWSVASSLAFGPADAREGKKESARGGVSATAGIINNKGIGTGDWWLHHDWRSIHHLFALLTKDWPGISAARLPRLLASFFLRSPLRLVAAPLCLAIIALVLITQAIPAQLVWRKTTYCDFNFPPVRATMTTAFPNPLIWRPPIKDLLGVPTLWFLIPRRFRMIRFYYSTFLWSLPANIYLTPMRESNYRNISCDMSSDVK